MILAYLMYFLAGCTCVSIGTCLPYLMDHFNLEMEIVVLLSASLAFGRLSTVYLTNQLLKKIGPVKIIGLGCLFILFFTWGISINQNFRIALLSAFIGGAGYGAQDNVCPVILQQVKEKEYAALLSLGQAFFGAGAFFIPFFMTIVISNGYSYVYGLAILAFIAITILMLCSFSRNKLISEPKPRQIAREKTTKNSVQTLDHQSKAQVFFVALITFLYAAGINTIYLYTSSLGDLIGLSEKQATIFLTLFNAGVIIGSVVFAHFLKKRDKYSIFVENCTASFIIIILIGVFKNVALYYIGFFVVGILLGFLFSILISIFTEVLSGRSALAGAMVAMSGGLAEIVNPMITGFIVNHASLRLIPFYFMVILGLLSTFGIIMRKKGRLLR